MLVLVRDSRSLSPPLKLELTPDSQSSDLQIFAQASWFSYLFCVNARPPHSRLRRPLFSVLMLHRLISSCCQSFLLVRDASDRAP